MKKTNIAFFLLAAIIMMNSLSALSQEAKLTKEEKKAQKRAALEYNFKIQDSLISTRKFILVGDYALTGNGERTTLNQAMNYVIVNAPKGIIYAGSNYNTNGVPREGNIGVYKSTKSEKNLSFTLQFDINSPLGRFDVLMDILATNLVTVTISGQSLPSFTWEGHLETLQRVKVFKVIN
jgi:hypothetical protein